MVLSGHNKRCLLDGDFAVCAVELLEQTVVSNTSCYVVTEGDGSNTTSSDRNTPVVSRYLRVLLKVMGLV